MRKLGEMTRSNLAYQQPKRLYEDEPLVLPRPQLRTIEGQGRKTSARTQQAPWIRTLMVMSALAIVVLATVSVARVSFANATVQVLQNSEQLRGAIDQARAEGLELEVQHSLANNPNRIQDAAAGLGILPAGQPETLAAQNNFSEETLAIMQAAAEEAHTAELAQLQAAAAQNSATKAGSLGQSKPTLGAAAPEQAPTAAALVQGE